MGVLRVRLPDGLEGEFRRRAAEAFGERRGSVSRAAEEAIQRWTSERETLSREHPPPGDPVRSLRGMLRDVKESSVELQHEASRIRASKRK